MPAGRRIALWLEEEGEASRGRPGNSHGNVSVGESAAGRPGHARGTRWTERIGYMTMGTARVRQNAEEGNCGGKCSRKEPRGHQGRLLLRRKMLCIGAIVGILLADALPRAVTFVPFLTHRASVHGVGQLAAGAYDGVLPSVSTPKYYGTARGHARGASGEMRRRLAVGRPIPSALRQLRGCIEVDMDENRDAPEGAFGEAASGTSSPLPPSSTLPWPRQDTFFPPIHVKVERQIADKAQLGTRSSVFVNDTSCSVSVSTKNPCAPILPCVTRDP